MTTEQAIHLKKNRLYTRSSLASPQNGAEDVQRPVGSWELAWRLAMRVISAQHRQVFFGLLLAFILPLDWHRLGALPYAVYVFSGSMLWATDRYAVKFLFIQ